ncbi:MAG TPA: alpha/beta fold hydrolase [Candidatus Acidoferrales bacterium]|nr:alpha/beta fold hydrolase [Candidatus Acidoferrales bacterium]
MNEFQPYWGLRNGHLMTIVGAFLRRRFPQLPVSAARLFEVEPGTKLRGDCHWQQDRKRHPTLVLLHGLEGSSESGYMLGTAEKAFLAGWNVMRLNQRNCGGTEQLTETLYHSGRSADFRTIVLELIERDSLPAIVVAGFSMGGNLALKMAGEFGKSAPAALRGIVAVAPCLDLAACSDALSQRRNFLFNRHFVESLKRRMRKKARLFPHVYGTNGLAAELRRVRSVREFDEAITARFSGFRGADDYYARSSAMHFLEAIRVPTLIVAAQNDPFVPFRIFQRAAIGENPNIQLLAPPFGGHCAFISQQSGEERFWCEARVVEFCAQRNRLC